MLRSVKQCRSVSHSKSKSKTRREPSRRDELRQQVLRHMKGDSYQPSTKSELARALGLDPKERATFRKVLTDLEEDGTVSKLQKGRYRLGGGGKPGTARGRIDFLRSGKAFVTLQTCAQGSTAIAQPGERIFVSQHLTGTALPGDIVEIALRRADVPEWVKHSKKAGGRQQDEVDGKVTKVITRGGKPIVGLFKKHGGFFTVKPDDKRYPETVEILPYSKDTGARGAAPKAKAGDIVVVELVKWDQANRPPVGRIVKILGKQGEKGVDIESIVHRHGLPLEFPPEVQSEAKAVSNQVGGEDLRGREDWRDRLVVTIDPFDARDFDDAISVEALEGGGWKLAVHIADVSHYVKPGSALDKEASRRGNSTYLVDRVIPMLPESLSNGICSLRPNEDRLTQLVEIEFSPAGKVVKTHYASAVICSAKRFTYEEAMEVIRPVVEGKQPRSNRDKPKKSNDPITEMLREAWRLASKLRVERFKHGSLDLDFAEVKIILDDKGHPTELRKVEYDESHQLIEEFMLVANEQVARVLKTSGKPAMFRVHEEPDADKLIEYREMALSHGFKVGDLSVRAELQKLLKMIKGSFEEHTLKLGLLKSLKRAVYDVEPLGHFGLSKVNYTHFTSPIRRYADLIVHRALCKLSLHAPQIKMRTPTFEGMKEIAENISRTERVSSDAEMDSKRLKEMEYFAHLVETKSSMTFPAVINDVRRNGLFVELITEQVRGLVPVSAFPEGDFFFAGEVGAWQSQSPRVDLRVGNKVDVQPMRVDFDNMFIDFQIVAFEDHDHGPLEKRAAPAGQRRPSGGNRSANNRRGSQKKSTRGKSSGRSRGGNSKRR